MSYENLGKMAFDAYKRTMRGKTYDGKDIPEWEKVSSSVKEGWQAAAEEVAGWVNPNFHSGITDIADAIRQGGIGKGK